MQIKTVMRYYYTATRMAKILKLTASNAVNSAEQLKHSHIAAGNAKLYSHFGKQFGI